MTNPTPSQDKARDGSTPRKPLAERIAQRVRTLSRLGVKVVSVIPGSAL
ncbi:hypothetical protein [Methylocaldum sp.]|nr:hypothetical protein [Methylocaldum sp.]HYE38211.1 hypothetical protein [Methylocaldum sp.]